MSMTSIPKSIDILHFLHFGQEYISSVSDYDMYIPPSSDCDMGCLWNLQEKNLT